MPHAVLTFSRPRITLDVGYPDTIVPPPFWPPRAGSGDVKIDPLRFLVGCRTIKATKPGLALSVVYLSMFYCIVVY